MQGTNRVALTLTLLMGILVFLVLILTMPSSTTYSVLNNDNMGLSGFYAVYKPLVVLNYDELSRLNASSAVLVINRLNKPSEGELNRLKLFVEEGGVVVASGSSLFLNSILSCFNLGDNVSDYHVYDLVFNKGSTDLIVASCSICNSSVVVYKALLYNVEHGEPVIATSNYSYVDLNGNRYWDLGEPINSTIIAARYFIGRGLLYVVAAEGLIVNSVLNYNDAFMRGLLDKRTLIVDQSFAHANTLEYLKILKLTGELTPYVALIMASLSIMIAFIWGKPVRHWHENKKLLTTVLITYSVTALYGVLTTGEYYYVLLLVFNPLYYLAKGLYRFISGYAFSLLYLYLNPGLNLVLGLILVFFTILIFYEYLLNASSVEKPLLSLVEIVLIYTPIFVLEPVTVVPGVLITLMLIMAVFAEYVELSVFKVELISSPLSIYLGDAGKIELEIHGKGEAGVHVYLNNKLVENLNVKDHAKLELIIKPEYAGLQKYFVNVELKGRRGLAKLLLKPMSIEVRVIPRHTSIARLAKAILEKYIHEVRAPIILYMSPREAHHVKPGGVPVFNWSTSFKVYDVLEKTIGKSVQGDYAGAREYIPGDSPRSIHWKKSISMSELIVKEYSTTHGSETSYSTVIIADWIAPNPIELDMLIEATYSAVIGDKSPKVLLLKVPRAGVYLVKGKAIDVLAALESIIKTERIEALFNYESWPRVGIITHLEVNTEIYRNLVKYYEIQAGALVNELEKQGVLRGSLFYTIYSKSLSLKYNIMTKYMVEHGYRSALLRKISYKNLMEAWSHYEA